MRQRCAVCNKDKVSWIRLQKSEVLIGAEIIHNTGDRKWIFLKYNEPVIRYHNWNYTLEELEKLLEVGLEIKEDKIVIIPQLKVFKISGNMSGIVNTYYYKTDEDAEKAFEVKVKEYKLVEED